MFIFQRKGSPPVVAVRDVPEGSHIGGVLGNEAYYKESAKYGHIIDYVVDDQQNIDKLRLKRLNYIYGFFPNLKNYKNELSFNEKKPILEIPDSIICYENERTKKFISILDKKLKPVVDFQMKPPKKIQDQTSKDQKNLLLRDLLADILPPPLFIVENHLKSVQLFLEISKKKPDLERIEKLIHESVELQKSAHPLFGKTNFNDRVAYWGTENSKQNDKLHIWKSYSQGAMLSAKKYFEIQEHQYFPAIHEGNLEKVRQILRDQLNTTYAQHRVQIDWIVSDILTLEDSIASPSAEFLKAKDLMIDVLPPPLFIIEAYLSVLRIFEELVISDVNSEEKIENLILFHRTIEGNAHEVFDSTSFRSKVVSWRSLINVYFPKDIKLKNFFEKSVQLAERYFSIVNKSIIHSLHKGKGVFNFDKKQQELEPLFEEQQKIIEEMSLYIRNLLSVQDSEF